MDIEKLRRDHSKHWKKACAIRTLTLDAVAAANSGHSGAPIGMADVATILFEKHLKFDSQMSKIMKKFCHFLTSISLLK